MADLPALQGQVVTPSAIAGPVGSAVFAIGQVLKDIIHNSGSYRNENDVLAALGAVDSLVNAFLKDSERPAVATGEERAPIEDVSLRKPPPGYTVPGPVVNQVIDYDKLAAAIVRMQMQYAPQVAAAPEVPAEQPPAVIPPAQ